MRHVGKFTSLNLIVVFAMSGTCFAQAWPPWADDAFGRRPLYERMPERQQDSLEDERKERPRQAGSDIRSGGARPDIVPVAPPVTAFAHDFPANSIVIDTGGRKLYYVLPDKRAYEYPISVGREGFNWTGTETVSRKQAWPDWYPPAEMRERDSSLPEKMTGGLKNPLGAMALYLGNTLYRIHGTNDVKSIGQAQSSGCFRMLNSAVLHLASMAEIGTSVAVVSSLKPQAVSRAPEPPVTREEQAAAPEPQRAREISSQPPAVERASDYRALRTDFDNRR
jgi:lipoprotein-anchoring transpeptidase ErfK/SrfK